jgi:hypothetical protein
VAEDEEIHCLGVGCGWKWFRWLGFRVCGVRVVGVKDAGVGAGQRGCGWLGVRLRIVHGLGMRFGHDWCV